MIQFDDQMGPERPTFRQRLFGGRNLGQASNSTLSRFGRSAFHKGGASWAKAEIASGWGIGGLIGKAFVGYSMYKGYQQDGFSGALAAGATHLATTYAMGAVLGSVSAATGGVVSGTGLAVMAGVGAVAGLASYAAGGPNPLEFLARPYVREQMMKHSALEMGKPQVDQFGTLATMRQRSLAAIQNSKINGRTALGNEASIMYRPYFR